MQKEIKKIKNKNGRNTINRFNIFFVNLQVVLTILTVIIFVIFLFKPNMSNYLQFSLGSSLIVMAYNNHIIYKTEKMTVVYLIVGIILLILSFLSLWV